MIRVEGLKKRFGAVQAVDDVVFDVFPPHHTKRDEQDEQHSELLRRCPDDRIG